MTERELHPCREGPARLLRPSLLLFLLLAGGCVPARKPALVVLVAVDQLRGDLLERYDTLFTGGFRRLLDEGFRFTGAVHDHAVTETVPGHATLATGVFPSRHGMVGNLWWERGPEGWRTRYAVEDTLAHILGFPALAGRSPEALLREGLGDWVLAADTAARAVSISRMDGAAVTLGGRTARHVYWIADQGSGFVTSSHYGDRYPPWVERFNRDVAPRVLGDSVWESVVPGGVGGLVRSDGAPHEEEGADAFFIHRFHEEEGGEGYGALHRWVLETPFPDAAVAALAREAVRALELGADPVPDYLALSFSQTDAVGARYGPLSPELLDALLRLDRILGELMDFLDEAVGPGRWIMALSAGHGTLTIPGHPGGPGGEGRRATPRELAAVERVFAGMGAAQGEPSKLAEEAAAALRSLAHVADAHTLPELMSGPPPDSFALLYRNSQHPERWVQGYGSQGTGVVFRFEEGFLPSLPPRGTASGSPYHYDRHVPLILLGSRVAAGVSRERVATVDLAPTLANLARIPAPPDLDGRPLFQ